MCTLDRYYFYMKQLICIPIIIVFLSATVIDVPNEYPTIQEGIDVSIDGDTVLVQPGTYVENVNFNGHNIVLGSVFLLTGDTSFISLTVIDGNQSGSVVTFESGEDSTAVLIGLMVRNGLSYFGSGIKCESSNPTLLNLIVSENSASPTFENGYGGGLFCWNASAELHSVTFVDNDARNMGGGVYCYSNSNPLLLNVTISDNTTDGRGGGIACHNSSPSLVNVYITSNSSGIEMGGGSLLRIQFKSTTFKCNNFRQCRWWYLLHWQFRHNHQ